MRLSLLLTELHKYFTWRAWIFFDLWMSRELVNNLSWYLLVLHNLRNRFPSALVFWELSYFIQLSLSCNHFIWNYLHLFWLITLNTLCIFLIRRIGIVFKIVWLFLAAHQLLNLHNLWNWFIILSWRAYWNKFGMSLTEWQS